MARYTVDLGCQFYLAARSIRNCHRPERVLHENTDVTAKSDDDGQTKESKEEAWDN